MPLFTQFSAAVIPPSDARRTCLVHVCVFKQLAPEQQHSASTTIASTAATMHQIAATQPLRQATMGTSTSLSYFAISAAATTDNDNRLRCDATPQQRSTADVGRSTFAAQIYICGICLLHTPRPQRHVCATATLATSASTRVTSMTSATFANPSSGVFEFLHLRRLQYLQRQRDCDTYFIFISNHSFSSAPSVNNIALRVSSTAATTPASAMMTSLRI
jgi:hypothetical protein